MPRPLYRWERAPIPIALERVWTDMEKRKFLAPTSVRTPGHPAHGQSLYRLQYPGTSYVLLVYSNCDR
jgi:hypothetical protein